MAERPEIAAPSAGWASVMGQSPTQDLSRIPVSPIVLVNTQYRCQPGKGTFVAKRLEATWGRYYRQQKGCLAHVHGLCRENPDIALSSAVFASLQDWDRLMNHTNDDDQSNLDTACAEAYAALQGGSLATGKDSFRTEKVFGEHAADGMPDEARGSDDLPEYPSFDQIFPNGIEENENIPSIPLFISQGKLRIQKDKVEECTRGLEASMGKYYRSFPGIPWYVLGICKEDPNSILVFGCFETEKYYESLPPTAEDLEKLNAARGPYIGMFDGPMEEAGLSFKTSECYGTPF